MASRLFCWTTFLRPAWPIIVILFFVQGKVTAADIEFIGCSTIKEGATTPIVATFNASKRAGCTLSPLTTVTFRVVNQGYANDDICTQDVSTGATCDSTVKPGGCSCRSRVGDFWTFDFAFDFVPQRHENGTLLLAHGCIPSVTFTSNNCSDLKSAPPTTGPPSTTETNHTSSEASGSSTSTAPPSPSDSTSTPSTPLTKTVEVPTPTRTPSPTNSTRESSRLHPWQEGLIAGGVFIVICGGTVFVVVIVRRRRSRRTQKELPCEGDRTVHENGNFSNGSINNEEHSHVSRF